MTDQQVNEMLAGALRIYFMLEKEGRDELAKEVLALSSKLALQVIEQERENKETSYDHAFMDVNNV